MRAAAFSDFAVNQRVRFFSDNPDREPQGTITRIDHVSEHLVISWDDYAKPSGLDALQAIRKLEIIEEQIL